MKTTGVERALVIQEFLCRAIEIHILEPEDLTEAGAPKLGGQLLVDSLVKRGRLTPSVIAALERLVELQAKRRRSTTEGTARWTGSKSGSRFNVDQTRFPGRAQEGRAAGGIRLGPDDQTVSPAREQPKDSGDPHLETGAARVEPHWETGGVKDGTVIPKGEERAAALAVDEGTVAPNDDGPPGPLGPIADTVVPARSDAGVGAALGIDRGTVAPAREADGSSVARAVENDTLVSRREAELLARPPYPLNVESGTIARSRESLSAESSDGPGDELVDLSLLELGHRRVLEEAAFCRICLKLSLATPAQIEAAMAKPDTRVEDALVAMGVLDAPRAMDVYVQRQTMRAACGTCFAILPPLFVKGRPCPSCGNVVGGTRTTGTSRTLVGSELRSARGIEGFPGEGGVFAGYELLERVAEGGMGVVFRARQIKLNRVVALKVMRGGSLASKARRRRFLQEAEAAAALRHPSIVPVHEIDETAGYPFYTMDFVEGVGLDEYVRSRKSNPEEVVALGRMIADAVQHFHLHGIIHRDLKPDNVLVGRDGVPKIIDFGIAKKIGTETDSGTIEGDVLGTPHYMSPEQAAGRVRDVDTRTDVYALGTILYELLTGAPPFDGLPQAKLVVAIQEDDPTPVRSKNPTVEPDLEAIVQKAMAKERERRYQSAADLASDLERYEQHLPITARPATFTYRLRKALRRRLPAVIASAVVLLVLSAVGIKTAYESQLEKKQLAERQAKIDRLMAEAGDEKLPIPDRMAKLQQVHGMDPENRTAAAQLSLLKDKQTADQRLAEERMRADQSRLEEQLKTEKANQALNAERAAQRARDESEQKGRERIRAQASRLRDEGVATRDKDRLAAWGLLNDALALLPADQADYKDTRASIEADKVALDIDLARENLRANKADMAEFWLDDAKRLQSNGARADELREIAGALAALTDGRREFEEAKRFFENGNLIAARKKLEEARKLGLAQVDKELAIVLETCRAKAAERVGDGQSALGRGDPLAGLQSARQALAFDPDSAAAKALASDCEQRIGRDALAEAARLFALPEGRAQSIARLAEAVSKLQGPELQNPALVEILEREKQSREKLLGDAKIGDLVYVPEVPQLGVKKPVYILRTEVTNALYKQFVDAKGYYDSTFWDAAAQDRLASFRDGCPGGQCAHRAPRTWREESFGDPGNADRPVTGVTIFEARAFTRFYSKLTGMSWRLPTKSEWEVAAGWDPVHSRLQKYAWGDEFDASRIWIHSDLPQTVGSSGDTSPLGLADAGGNVFEWVECPGPDAGTTIGGTKKADYACDAKQAVHFALVANTKIPPENAPVELVSRIGFRIVR
jgi:tRNA A-37 threonylcarbamoyl transferase component Bud32